MAADIEYVVVLVDESTLSATGTPITDDLVTMTGGDRLSDVTPFSFEMRPEAEPIEFGDPGDPAKVVKLVLQGEDVWAGIIDRRTRDVVKEGEESQENVVYGGTSLGVFMNRMAMRPSMGFVVEPWGPSRIFSFAEVHYDNSPWDFAIELPGVLDPSLFWLRGEPSGYPSMAGPSIACDGDTDAGATQGYRYYIKDFPVDEDTAVAVFVSIDNSGDGYMDGFQFLQISAGADTTEGLRTARTWTGFLTASTEEAPTHRIAFRVVNVPFGGGDPGPGAGPSLAGNPTRLMAVGYKVDEFGLLGDKLFEVNNTWSALCTPSVPPGETFGLIATVVKNQQQATLTGLDMYELDFDEFVDSADEEWDPIETWATQVGDSWLKLMKDAGQIFCDWRIAYPLAKLQAWKIGTYDNDSGVTYVLDEDNEVSTLRELTRDKQDIGTDAVIVTWPGGQIRVPEEGGSRCGFIQLGAGSIGEAKMIAQATIDQQGQPEQIAIGVKPTGVGDLPGKDWKVGDTIHVADGEGGTLDERGMGWDFKILGDSIDFTAVVRDLLQDDVDRLTRTIQSLNNGSLGGSAPSAPSGRKLPDVGKISASEVTFHLQGNTNIGEAPAHRTPTKTGNLYGVRCAIPSKAPDGSDIITTADTVFNLWYLDVKGGTPVVAATATIPAGEWVGIAAVDPILPLYANESEVWPEVTESADEATEATVEPLVV